TDPRGITAIRNEYDDSGRLVRQIDGDGNAIEFTHNISDRHEFIADQLGNSTLLEYDQNGNIIRMTDAEGNLWQYLYDQNDNLLSVVNPLGHETRYSYDQKGNLLSLTVPHPIPADTNL